ncbi:MAG: hypothetical protein IK075_05220 [Prevotella sp.]|nr:hypothetical protein [Prevotella sp.]
MALLIDGCVIMACCGGFSREDSKVANSNEVLLKDTMTKSNHLASEMAVQVESGIVLEHVHNIYNLVKHETQNMGGSVDNDLLDKAYCSKSWNELLMAVRKKEFKTNNTFFVINHWTMAYDTNQVSFDEFEVKYCHIGANNERFARVDFTVYTPDSYIPARIDLVYEDGEWKIDNFHHLKYMMDMKECMWEFLLNDHS